MLKVFVAVTLLIGVTLGEYTSPVFLWGVNSPALPSLPTVKKDDFANLIAPLLKTHSLVVFQEEQLTGRDFLCHKAAGGDTCYAHLQGYSPKTFYASVQSPSEALRAISEKREYNIVDSEGNLQAPLKCEIGKITFVNFDDLAEDNERNANLAAHDAAIAKISKDLSDCKVAYLYMSTPTIKKRAKRATAATSGGYIFRSKNQFLMFFSEILYNSNDQKDSKFVPVDMSAAVLTLENSTDFKFSAKLAGAQTLSFDITFTTDGYYTMSNVMFAGRSYYASGLNAPTTFSFSCGNLTLNTVASTDVTSTTPTAYLQINSFQFQAPFSANTPDDFKFGDSWDCTPFFTPGILMGFFVIILMLTILFTGICWLMDINTMDRFDDPKGKTITINANE